MSFLWERVWEGFGFFLFNIASKVSISIKAFKSFMCMNAAEIADSLRIIKDLLSF